MIVTNCLLSIPAINFSISLGRGNNMFKEEVPGKKNIDGKYYLLLGSNSLGFKVNETTYVRPDLYPNILI